MNQISVDSDTRDVKVARVFKGDRWNPAACFILVKIIQVLKFPV